MYEKLDIANWDRKDHYYFFRNFEEPFFGVTVNIDCTAAYQYCKQNNCSFFLYYLYQSIKCANAITAFKYRIIEKEVVLFDQINASTTVNRPNGTFGFAHLKYYDNFLKFENSARSIIEKVQRSNGLTPGGMGDNVILYSSLPWLNFTALSHARNFSFRDSCPKITFGKMTDQNGIKSMPLSIHVHHALMDGVHVGAYVERLQEMMNEVE